LQYEVWPQRTVEPPMGKRHFTSARPAGVVAGDADVGR
jgi:hypothetical protein